MTSKKQLIIMIGDYSAGKTTSAKWYAKNNNGFYINFESLYYTDRQDETNRFHAFVHRLEDIIYKSQLSLYVMDGLRDDYQDFIYIKNILKCDIHLCFCFAAPHIIRQRQIRKIICVDEEPLPRDLEELKRRTYTNHDLTISTDNNPLFLDSTGGFNLISKEDWPEHWKYLLSLSEPYEKSLQRYCDELKIIAVRVITRILRSKLFNPLTIWIIQQYRDNILGKTSSNY